MSINKKIIFIDAFSTIHVGNGALLDNSYHLASSVFDTKNISIVTSDPKTNRCRYPNIIEDVFSNYPTNRIAKLIWTILFFINCTLFYLYKKLKFPQKLWFLGNRFKTIATSISESDIVISISGESINDHFAPQMFMRIYLFYICTKLGKALYIFPQSIGPIFRTSSRIMLKHALSNAKVIFARDNESFSLASSIWEDRPVRVIYCPDVAVMQESAPDNSLRIFHSGRKVVGITLSDVPNEITGSAGYVEKMIEGIITTLTPNEHAILMMPSNYQTNGVSRDYRICESAKIAFEAKGFQVELLKDQAIHPEQYQGIQKCLYLFISSRMHVGILGTSAAVPTIMLNTQHKIRGYMKNIGMESYVMEYADIELQLPKLIKKCMSNNSDIRQLLKAKNSELRYMVFETIRTAVTK